MIFAAFNGAATIHMFLFAPETRGMTLEEMDTVFDVSIHPSNPLIVFCGRYISIQIVKFFESGDWNGYSTQ